jgi:hypothetical protein
VLALRPWTGRRRNSLEADLRILEKREERERVS